MHDKVDRMHRAAFLVQQAQAMLSEAASLLRDANHNEDLTYRANHLEAESCMLEVHVRQALATLRRPSHQSAHLN
jgi:hypothetical protein